MTAQDKWLRYSALEAAAVFLSNRPTTTPDMVTAVAAEFERHLARPVAGPSLPPAVAYPSPSAGVVTPEGTAAIQEPRRSLGGAPPMRDQYLTYEGHVVRVEWSVEGLAKPAAGGRIAIMGKMSADSDGQLYVAIPDPTEDYRVRLLDAGKKIERGQELIASLRDSLKLMDGQKKELRNEHRQFLSDLAKALDCRTVTTDAVMRVAAQRVEVRDLQALLTKTEDEKGEFRQRLINAESNLDWLRNFKNDVAVTIGLEPSADLGEVMSLLQARLSEAGNAANPIMRQGDLSYEKLIKLLGGRPGDHLEQAINDAAMKEQIARSKGEGYERELDRVRDDLRQLREILGAQEEYEDDDQYVEMESTLDAARRVVGEQKPEEEQDLGLLSSGSPDPGSSTDVLIDARYAPGRLKYLVRLPSGDWRWQADKSNTLPGSDGAWGYLMGGTSHQLRQLTADERAAWERS